MDPLVEMLELGGFQPAKDQSMFENITQGMAYYCKILYEKASSSQVPRGNTIAKQILMSEAIEQDLRKLKCPRVIHAHQIQGLDHVSLLPVIQWLIKSAKDTLPSHPIQGGATYSRLEFSKFGKAVEVLELKSGLEIPVPGRNEIIVKVTTAPIHPSVLGLIRGTYGYKPSLPAVPGNEGAGVVHSLGENVTEFTVGQRVCFSHEGAWSEYISLKKRDGGSFVDGPVLAIDDAVPDRCAGQFFVNPCCAYVMMFGTGTGTRYQPYANHSLAEELHVEAGKWLIQSASGSTLGRVVIQLAKHKGVNMINLVRRPEQVEELQSAFGSETHVVVFDGSNTDEALLRIKAITGGHGVQYGIDAVAGATTDLMVKALESRGRVLVYGVLSSTDLKLNAAEMLFKEISVSGFWLSPWLKRASLEKRQQIYTELMQLMKQKVVVPAVEGVYSFSEYIAAINHSMQKAKSGKVLFVT